MTLLLVAAAYLFIGLVVGGVLWRYDPPQDSHDYQALVFGVVVWPLIVLVLAGDFLFPSGSDSAVGLAAAAALLALAALLLATANGV